jgi:hypothetical protein
MKWRGPRRVGFERWGAKGMALVLTLLVLGVCSALGAGLVLITMPERLAGGSHRDSIAALNAADAALELAARELEAIADWNTVLAGAVQSRLVDGPPSGVRRLTRGNDIDLTVLTHQLTCDRSTLCSDASVHSRTVERPWGNNNPRWRLFVYTPLAAVAPTPEFADAYVVVWIGDDGGEADGDPSVDGGAASGVGSEVVRARAESFGPGATRRVVEANLLRRDGIRVQSWRTMTPGVP